MPAARRQGTCRIESAERRREQSTLAHVDRGRVQTTEQCLACLPIQVCRSEKKWMDSGYSGASGRTCVVLGVRGDMWCAMRVCVCACVLWSSLDGREVDELRRAMQRELTATALDGGDG